MSEWNFGGNAPWPAHPPEGYFGPGGRPMGPVVPPPPFPIPYNQRGYDRNLDYETNRRRWLDHVNRTSASTKIQRAWRKRKARQNLKKASSSKKAPSKKAPVKRGGGMRKRKTK